MPPKVSSMHRGLSPPFLRICQHSKRPGKDFSFPGLLLCWHLLIFPGRFQPSIFSASELNCRVRDGNGCTLTAIGTDYN